jgi:hypothetical protein
MDDFGIASLIIESVSTATSVSRQEIHLKERKER